MAAFFLILLLLALLRIVLPFVQLPTPVLPVATVVVTVVFVASPIFAIFVASRHPWSARLAAAFLLGGAAVHAAFGAWARLEPVATLVAGAVAQIGLVCWTVGLGALIATMIRDKNLIIPVAIFLVAFDVFLVLTPVGPTRVIMEAIPEALPAVAMAIPQVGRVEPFAYVGPADLLFLGMFFIAIHRFRMRARQTLIALVPTLLLYLLFTIVVGPIPLLVPIGLVVLAVNLPEFKMNSEEKLSTLVVAVLAIGLVIWGMTRPAPPVETSSEAPAPELPAPAE
jgi:hypothetical protein